MITINRNNYEEFFILYIDNELNAGEKKMVEDFAAQHPDLKEELDLLLSSKLIPDHTLSFEGKEQLYKTAPSSSFNDTNLQESLLLHLDNELPAAEQAALISFIESNPAAQQEWNLLQQTRLEPETITCPDKESLYRKEEKAAATIIRFRWWRVAAAAVVLLIGGYFTYNTLTGNAGGGTESTVAKSGDPKNVQPVATPKNNNVNPQDQQLPEPGTVNPVLKAADAMASVNEENKPGIRKQQPNTTVVNYTEVQPENKTQQPVIAAANLNENTNSLTPLNTAVQTVAANTNTNPSLENIKKSGVTIQSPAPLDNQTTARINNKEIPDEEYAAAEPERKNKLRGFFRKTTRMFERTTNISATDGDDRLLIGGLAVRLK